MLTCMYVYTHTDVYDSERIHIHHHTIAAPYLECILTYMYRADTISGCICGRVQTDVYKRMHILSIHCCAISRVYSVSVVTTLANQVM
jgi:hypothetical protein